MFVLIACGVYVGEVKLIVIVGFLSICIIAAGYAAREIRQAGYNQAQAELYDEYKKKMLDAKEEIKTAEHEAEFYRAIAIELQQTQPTSVTKYVTKVIKDNSNCTNISGVSELWNGIRNNYH